MELDEILNEISELLDTRLKEGINCDISTKTNFGSKKIELAKQLIELGETDRATIITAMFFPLRKEFSFPVIKQYDDNYCLENKFYAFATTVIDGIHPFDTKLPNNIISAKILSNYWYFDLKKDYDFELKDIYFKRLKELQNYSNSNQIINQLFFAYNKELRNNQKIIDELKIELEELVKQRSSFYNSELEDKISMIQIAINYAKGL